MSIICIYHGNCPDGFASAWVVNQYYQDDIEFYPGVYGNTPPDVKNKDVIIVDFSYKRPVMLNMINDANSILVIDHHTTAKDELIGLDENKKVELVFDMEHSGCILTWNYFFPDKNPPELMRHIEDRDLWLFKLKNTKEIMMSLFSYEYDFNLWDNLMKIDTHILYEEGKVIKRKHEKDIKELIDKTMRYVNIRGFNVPIANLPYTMASDAGHIMCQNYPFAATYFDTYEGTVFSLRSNEDGEDVSKIAAYFGGGGHKHAAGFRLAPNNFDMLNE